MKFNFSIGSFNFGLGREAKPKAKDFSNAYEAARMSLINADWASPQTSANAEIAPAAQITRGRARELERNNEYVPRYLTLLENNVLGAGGIGFQNKSKDIGGKLDDLANKSIESAWSDFSKRDNCDVSGQICWREIEGLALRRTAVDGSSMIRIHRGSSFKYGIAFEVFEIDRLDIFYTGTATSGNSIRFGIEFDSFRRPVAYYIWREHPGDMFASATTSQKRERVPASDIIHLYTVDRPGQSIGMPWFTCVMPALEMLAKYRFAKLVAARMAACAGYAITPATPDGWSGERANTGEPLQQMTPGMGMLLNPGDTMQQLQPNQPSSVDFEKTSLRGIAGGMAVSYASLANDGSDANYSSMRQTKLEETEEYRGVQSWLIENLHDRAFSEWLKMALASAAIKMPNGSALPMVKFDKFNAPDWKPRRWPWVDPTKDLNAAILSVEKGFKSRQQIIAELGGDINETFLEIEADEALAELHGLDFPLGTNPQAAVDQVDPVEMSDEEKSKLSIEQIKTEMDAFGVGVRAGAITPSEEDENYFRERLKLAKKTSAVTSAWKKDGGTRRPITLTPSPGDEAKTIPFNQGQNQDGEN